jgi:hypothetical protein
MVPKTGIVSDLCAAVGEVMSADPCKVRQSSVKSMVCFWVLLSDFVIEICLSLVKFGILIVEEQGMLLAIFHVYGWIFFYVIYKMQKQTMDIFSAFLKHIKSFYRIFFF